MYKRQLYGDDEPSDHQAKPKRYEYMPSEANRAGAGGDLAAKPGASAWDGLQTVTPAQGDGVPQGAEEPREAAAQVDNIRSSESGPIGGAGADS